jgi:hypothetical protein
MVVVAVIPANLNQFVQKLKCVGRFAGVRAMKRCVLNFCGEDFWKAAIWVTDTRRLGTVWTFCPSI